MAQKTYTAIVFIEYTLANRSHGETMRILSVNVGDSRPVTIKNRTVQTGIYKIPATGPVPVSRYGLQDDVRVEPRKMGLEHNAVYAYPYEHYAYWQSELGREPFPLGQFGENLTVTGLLEEEVRIGDVFRFGNTVMQVAHPRIPCAKLNERMGLSFASMFLASRKVGYYLRVLREGSVSKDDAIELLERDEASPTMEEFVRVAQYEYWDAEALQHLLRARDLVPAWREMIEAKLERTQAASGWHGLREFEVVRRQQESEDTVSIYLKCLRGRVLAPFHGGQQLMVVLGKRSGHQQRLPYYLSSSPRDLSTYRITVRYTDAPEQAESDSSVSSQLIALKVGETIKCNAPYGVQTPVPEQTDDRTPVLLSQGLGIAPMLSLMYELEGRQVNLFLFHEPVAHEPQGLLREVSTLMAQNPGFQMIHTESGVSDHINAELVRLHVPLAQSDINVAGSRGFIERMVNEFMALDISPAALITHNIG
jgi:MOSC domain-containing protein YiiM/ferredoxin-NADP reductase